MLFVVGVPEADAPYISGKINPKTRLGLSFMGGGGLMSPDLFLGTQAKVRVSAMKGGAGSRVRCEGDSNLLGTQYHQPDAHGAD